MYFGKGPGKEKIFEPGKGERERTRKASTSKGEFKGQRRHRKEKGVGLEKKGGRSPLTVTRRNMLRGKTLCEDHKKGWVQVSSSWEKGSGVKGGKRSF